MKFSVRPATVKDLEDIALLCRDLCVLESGSFDPTVNPDWPLSESGRRYLSKRIESDDARTFVAVSRGKIFGYIIGAVTREEYKTIPAYGELVSIFVREQCRMSGAGRALFNAFAGWCRKRGISRFRTIASLANKAGMEFYKNMGFREWEYILEGDF